MRYIQVFTIIFLAISVSLSCSNHPDLNLHIDNLGKINSNIIEYKDRLIEEQSIINHGVFKDDIIGARIESFNHKLNLCDTTIYLDYKLCSSNKNEAYKYIHLTKEYVKNNKYHVIELFNNDTLYHYISSRAIEQSQFFVDYSFIKGKYYFMVTHNSGFFDEQQMIYFFFNVDSLINVRGNDLPELPRIDSISLEDFMILIHIEKLLPKNPFFNN